VIYFILLSAFISVPVGARSSHFAAETMASESKEPEPSTGFGDDSEGDKKKKYDFTPEIDALLPQVMEDASVRDLEVDPGMATSLLVWPWHCVALSQPSARLVACNCIPWFVYHFRSLASLPPRWKRLRTLKRRRDR